MCVPCVDVTRFIRSSLGVLTNLLSAIPALASEGRDLPSGKCFTGSLDGCSVTVIIAGVLVTGELDMRLRAA